MSGSAGAASPSGLVTIRRRRRLIDRAAAVAATVSFGAALAALVAVVSYTAARGLKRFDGTFLTSSMASVGPLDSGGGAYGAIIGTAQQVLLATVIAVPLGLLAAIYLSEYGRGRLARAIRLITDVMTGVPSIVAGLFVYAFWVIGLGRGFSGFAAALALSVLMLPVLTRSAEDMLRLVPASLREAADALGIARWRTILRVVLPTARTGLTTAIMLAIARVTGETAPLLLTSFGSFTVNSDPFHGPQAGLPWLIFQQAGSAFPTSLDRAWAGALTLILLVSALYLLARLLTRHDHLVRR